jgi:hypothetical protein
MVVGLPLISYRDDVCSSCILKKIIEIVLTNLPLGMLQSPFNLFIVFCIHLPFVSFSGFKYFLNFFDDFSKQTWLYLLKLKSESFDMLLYYKTLVKNLYINFKSYQWIHVANILTTGLQLVSLHWT